MKKRNLLMIWAKRAFFGLALAGTAGLMLPACEKEPIEQHDEEILYYKNNNNNPKWKIDTVNKYVADKHVRYIYITVAPSETFQYCNSDNISAQRRDLQEIMAISSKCRGRGDFDFKPGVYTFGDSLDFVKMGFTINQQNQQ
ncbi:MAG: hypothetical protein NC324_05045 [Bacteroides sp.]|nr:hypothetical protein [Bacteroides sp.]